MSTEPVERSLMAARAAFLVQREVARVADDNGFRNHAQEMGGNLPRAGLEKHQVRSLETLAAATTMLSEIYDFIKRQVGRKKWNREQGDELLNFLKRLGVQARRIAGIVRAECPEAVGDDTERQIHLALCREYLRHLVAEYLYAPKDGRR